MRRPLSIQAEPRVWLCARVLILSRHGGDNPLAGKAAQTLEFTLDACYRAISGVKEVERFGPKLGKEKFAQTTRSCGLL